MYADSTTIDTEILYQGDVIADFPFYLFEKSLPIKKEENETFVLNQTPNDGPSLFAIEAKKQSVMILSQTCDAQRRKNIILCPVYDLNNFITDNTLNVDRVRAIKERRNYYLFYLPAFQDFAESIADLQTMLYVQRETIEQYLHGRVLSLSDLGRHHLAWSLSTYFGRPVES